MDCSLPGSSVMEFSRQEYWSGLPFPSPGDLPDPGNEPGSPTLQADPCRGAPRGLFIGLITLFLDPLFILPFFLVFFFASVYVSLFVFLSV